MAQYVGLPKEEVVALLRRGSISFSRGSSRFKGVSRHHKHRKWEARIGGAGPDSR
jgi:AP2-like factor (ANT lineage)